MAAHASASRKRRTRKSPKRTIKIYGRYVVADSAVCHGALTFRGTRIFVHDVLSQVATGRNRESISQDWGGKVSLAAIAEAVRLAKEALLGEGVHPVVEAGSIVEQARN